jgi:dienelactone hydrolase
MPPSFALALFIAIASMWPLGSAVAQTVLDRSLNEQFVLLPIAVKTVDGIVHQREFVLTIFKPSGPGPFPTVIASHGRSMEGRSEYGRSQLLGYYFVRRGFAVLVPTRVGYGVSGYDIDPERSLKFGMDCDTSRYAPLAENILAHIRESITYAKQQPWVDAERLLLAGNSAGGFGSIVAVGDLQTRILAVVNFAGGAGGESERPGRPCNPGDVETRMADAARKRPVPSIWFYSENDRLWGPEVPRDWHAGYVRAGGLAELHMLPPLGQDGHLIVYGRAGIKLWRPHLDRFLTTLGFDPRKSPPGAPPPTGFAKIESVEAVPLVSEKGRADYKLFLDADIPRAFAIGPDGSWALGSTIENVLARCREYAKAACKLYAVNDDVVWTP